MRKSFVWSVVGLMLLSLTGCGKYEKDISREDSNLYGTYSDGIEGYTENSDEKIWIRNESYSINENQTFLHDYEEMLQGEDTKHTCDGKIKDIANVNDDIIKITLDTGDTKDVLYKYKNMLGTYYQAEISDDKTFNLVIPTPIDDTYPNAANVFDEDGNYHSCLDYTDCKDTEEEHMGVFYKYVRKGNLIYFEDLINNNYYQILYYVVDNGLFYKECIKE